MQDNKSIKLSVIIPCWNCSKYITKTLDSIKYSYSMSRKPILEIILVDDGSTDTSASLCDQLGQLDPRIRVQYAKKGTGLRLGRRKIGEDNIGKEAQG